jgi:hypothetical protein
MIGLKPLKIKALARKNPQYQVLAGLMYGVP